MQLDDKGQAHCGDTCADNYAGQGQSLGNGVNKVACGSELAGSEDRCGAAGIVANGDYQQVHAVVADGKADNGLDKVHAVNDVTSIVFDFRGYDTMGEAFILITAVAGSIVILYNAKKEKKEEDKDE